jgi:hypothetical protein
LFGVWGLGFKVQGLEFRVEGVGTDRSDSLSAPEVGPSQTTFGVWGSGFKLTTFGVLGSGFMFRVDGFGCRV